MNSNETSRIAKIRSKLRTKIDNTVFTQHASNLDFSVQTKEVGSTVFVQIVFMLDHTGESLIFNSDFISFDAAEGFVDGMNMMTTIDANL